MSRYAVDKVLWEIAQKAEAQAAFGSDPERFLADRDLEPTERAALLSQDVRAIYELGCHPFLLFFFAVRMAGGWSYGLMVEYVKSLEGLDLLDIET